MAQTIEVKIPLKGLSKGDRKLSIETDGFKGESCREATRALEGRLGMTQTEEEVKNEMYEAPEQRQEYLGHGGGDAPQG